MRLRRPPLAAVLKSDADDYRYLDPLTSSCSTSPRSTSREMKAQMPEMPRASAAPPQVRVGPE